MRVIHAKPETYDHRRRLRRSDMPNLQVFGTPPTIVKTTTDDVTDEEVGLDADAWAQAEAERFIRAALAYRRQEARKIETVS